MITVTYNGLGSSLYEGGASLLYDNHYVGAMMANWTRGTAVAHIRATGPVGTHTIEVADAISFKYLNIQQSPIPWGTGEKFDVHASRRTTAGRRRSIDWPANVAPTLDAKTTLQLTALAASTAASAQLSSSTGAGQLEGRHHRERPDAERAGRPRVVDGRRQPRQLHRHLLVVRLGPARQRDRDRRRLAASTITVPDGLGGWHVVQLIQDGQVEGAGSVLRQAEHLRQGRLLADAEGRPAVHRPPQGPRLDAARQHDRGRLRQQLRRLRLRLQQQRRHGHEPGGDRRARHAPDRHVPAALHAAAVVSEHARTAWCPS